MQIDRIIFWQPFASPHQESLLESLAGSFAGEVILGVEGDLPAERRAQGWRPTTHERVKVVDISVPAHHAALAALSTPASLHVFTGFFSHPLVWAGFRALADSPARLGIYSEAPEQTRATGWLKRLRGRMLAGRWAHRFAFVLAVGGVGCEFFSAIGFPEDVIVPFGYYLDVPPLASGSWDRPADGVPRFVSAGQLIRRKGVDVLVESCRRLPAAGWQLDIYGDGPERQALERLTRMAGLSSRVAFHGAIPNADMQRVLGEADCAVLPSRFDGWGMLVNESLAVGTPVICTSACGAAILLKQGQSGTVVPPDRTAPLSVALSDMLARGRISPQSRVAVNAQLAAQASADQAARRISELVESMQ